MHFLHLQRASHAFKTNKHKNAALLCIKSALLYAKCVFLCWNSYATALTHTRFTRTLARTSHVTTLTAHTQALLQDPKARLSFPFFSIKF